MVEVKRKIEIDLWKTSKFKLKSIGIKKKETSMAKSLQFTRGMGLIGEIKEEGKSHGNICLRKDISDERLVIKVFSSALTWLGTLDESISREVLHSYMLGHSFASMVLIIPRYSYVVLLEKNEGGLGQKETYGFALHDEDRFVHWYTIKKKRISTGDEWEVKNLQKENLAEIDGKMFDIGGQWDLKIYDEDLAKNHAFVTTLMLFAVFRKYEDQVETRIGQILDKAKQGKSYKLHKEEISLYENPRSSD